MRGFADYEKQGKFIAWYYIISGAIALIISIPAIVNSYITVLGAIAWLLLLVQIAAAIFGGIKILRSHPGGYQILYWVTISCIPVFGSSILTYYSILGFGLMPTMSFGVGYTGTSFLFKFGYDSALNFLSGMGITTIGVNLVALILMVCLQRILKWEGIRLWPLR